jgi:hypothetical protein
MMLLAAGVLTACGGSAPAADSPTPAAGETPPVSEAAVAAESPQGDLAEVPEADPASAEPEASEGGAAKPGSPSLSDGESRTMDVIQKVVLDNRQVFRNCYDAVQAKVPELKGDMTLHFVLSAEGRVLKAELNEQRSTIKNDELTQCAISELRKLQFPASSKGLDTKVNYPFNFNPR